MEVKNAEFIIGAVGPDQYPQTGYPEIALCGRSNVGKSSLINRMIGRKSLARTSSQPGKTQQLNYYLITTDLGPFYFVDLPGYGYAKVSRKEREKWARFIEAYLSQRETLQLVLQVVDGRHLPTDQDLDMWDWLSYHKRDKALVATKMDKLKKGQRKVQEDKILAALGQEVGAFFPVSSEAGFGLDVLKAYIGHHISGTKKE